MKYAAVKSSGRLAQLALPVACLCGVAYFTYHTLSGQYGLLALPVYQHHKAELLTRAEMLARDIRYYENRITLLNPAELDPDIAEELVRRQLGYVKPTDILIPLDE
ncbi:MAG: septum formation initiator family protein [Pseudomonadota bacterium]